MGTLLDNFNRMPKAATAPTNPPMLTAIAAPATPRPSKPNWQKNNFERYETLPDWRTLCREMLPVWAPDFTHYPGPYIIPREMKSMWAAVVPGGDVTFKDSIPVWLGRGPAILINDKRLYATAFHAATKHGASVELADEFAKVQLLGTVLHEAAHILSSRDFTAAPIGVGPDALEAFDSFDDDRPFTPNSGQAAIIPFNFHDATFIRCCVHLANRARRWGYKCPIDDMFAGARYGLSPAILYARALETETRAYPFGNIGEILKTRPPQAFVDLWRRDVREWWREIPTKPTAEQEAAALSALSLYQPIVGF